MSDIDREPSVAGHELDAHEAPSRRPLLVLLVVSAAVRLAAWVWVATHGVEPLFDEVAYVHRARAIATVLAELLSGSAPTVQEWRAAYARGVWPPLHSLLLVPGLLLSGGSVAGARLVVVLASVATTLVVVRVGARLAGPRAGLLAGWVHAMHPTFVAYSHLLWSETVFALLLLATLDAAFHAGCGRQGRLMVLAGASLGLAGLTRASSLPYLVLFPAWIFLRRDLERPRRAAGVMVAVALLFVGPWLAVLSSAEGRFVPLSTEGGWNLYLGNNPWIEDGTGSSWADAGAKLEMESARRALSQALDVDPDTAARRLAIDHARAHPRTTLVHGLERLRTFWMVDTFPARHLLHAVYPPLPPFLAATGLALLGLAHVVFLALVAVGLLARPPFARRRFLVWLLVLGMAPSVLSIGIPRLAFPVQLLLVPVAGYGLGRLVSRGSRRAALCAAATVAALVLGVATGLPGVTRGHLIPSSVYDPIVRHIESFAGVEVVRIDELRLRFRGYEGEQLRLSLAGGKRWFHVTPDNAYRYPRTFTGLVLHDRFDTTLTVLGWRADGPLVLEIILGDAHVTVEPVDRNAWRKWRPTGLPGVEIAWWGGGRLPPYE